MLTVFLLVILLSCSCSFAVPCSGPVTYNNTDFTIRGPCLNDVVIAPVGDTVQYRCDYEDRRTGLDLPYWHIAVLSGSPFIVEQTNDHELVVYYSSAEGYTTIDIPVQQQYLNQTLVIQCGLCSAGSVCYNPAINPLSENISSSTVGLVAFSTPSSLDQVLLADSLSLSWSPPPISVGYTGPVDFQYKVTLTNVMNTSQVLQFTTNNTHLNISQLLVPDDHNICSRHWWSVSAIVEERRSEAVQSNEMVFIPSVPFILSGSISTNITECSESVLISIDFRVLSCPDAGDLRHSLSLEVDADRTINSNSSSELLLRSIFVVKSIFIVPNLDEVFNSTITVSVSNRFGSETTSYELVEDAVNVYNTCDEDVTPSTTTVISSDTVSSSVISRSNDNNLTSTLSTSPSVLVIVTQPRTPSASNSDIMYISIAVGLVVALLLLAVIIIICVIIGLKLYKRKSVPITEKNPNSTSNGSNINFKLPFKLVSNMYHNVESSAVTPVSSTPNDMNGSQLLRSVEDCPSYATPLEIKETLTNRRSEVRMSRVSRPNSYANSQSVSTDITDTQGYTEPASTVPRVEEALYSTVTPSTSRTTTPTHLLVDTPGYSQPLVKKPRSIRKSKVVSTPRTSMSSLPVTPAHDSETPRSPQTLIIENGSNGCGTNISNIYDRLSKQNGESQVEDKLSYVDVNKIRRGKRARSGLSNSNVDPSLSAIEPLKEDSDSFLAAGYVDPNEIKKRKALKNMLFELKELPPTTPTHQLSKTPPTTPPPVTPPSSSPLHSSSIRIPVDVCS